MLIADKCLFWDSNGFYMFLEAVETRIPLFKETVALILFSTTRFWIRFVSATKIPIGFRFEMQFLVCYEISNIWSPGVDIGLDNFICSIYITIIILFYFLFNWKHIVCLTTAVPGYKATSRWWQDRHKEVDIDITEDYSL